MKLITLHFFYLSSSKSVVMCFWSSLCFISLIFCAVLCDYDCSLWPLMPLSANDRNFTEPETLDIVGSSGAIRLYVRPKLTLACIFPAALASYWLKASLSDLNPRINWKNSMWTRKYFTYFWLIIPQGHKNNHM